MCRQKLSETKFAKTLSQAKSYAMTLKGWEGFDYSSAQCQCGESDAIEIFGFDYQHLATVAICEACYEQYEDNRVS